MTEMCPRCNHPRFEHDDDVCGVALGELPTCRVCRAPMEALRAMPVHAPSMLMPNGGEALLIPTDLPGLFDMLPPDGSELRDLTIGQVRSLAGTNGWTVRQVTDRL